MKLIPSLTPGCVAEPAASGWRLEIPAGPAGAYRDSQLDDYVGLARSRFPWRAPAAMNLRARVSAPDLPGTWGFGFWNDLSFGLGGISFRPPALPNAAWFFFASPQNYLSFRDDKPAQGFIAATFRAPDIPWPLFALGLPAAPLLAFRPGARLLRRIAAQVIADDSASLAVDVTDWHAYSLAWGTTDVRFSVDGAEVLATPVSPRGRLGLIIWIDNQFAAFTPEGRLAAGTLENPAAWLEVADIDVR